MRETRSMKRNAAIQQNVANTMTTMRNSITINSKKRKSFNTRNNDIMNRQRMKALTQAGLAHTYGSKTDINDVENLYKYIGNLEKLNGQIKLKSDDYLKLWYALDTYHDIIEGERAPNFKKMLFSNKGENITKLSKFLFGDNTTILKLITILKPNEIALQNQNRPLNVKSAIKIHTSKSTLPIYKYTTNIDMLKKTFISNLISFYRQSPNNRGNRYLLREMICDRSILNEILKLNNIILLEDSTRYSPLTCNLVKKECVNADRFVISPAQLSNSAITSTQQYRKHIFINKKSLNLNSTNMKIHLKIYLMSNMKNRSLTWYEQCVDKQLHHKFHNYCGVNKDNKIEVILVKIKANTNNQNILIKNMIIYVNKKKPSNINDRYIYEGDTMHIFEAHGLSVKELDTFYSKITKQIKNEDELKRIGWLITDIKRSHDSTQVSFIKEYEKSNTNSKKLYLLTQDILCACKCLIEKVGCVLESKGRYFIFGQDILINEKFNNNNSQYSNGNMSRISYYSTNKVDEKLYSADTMASYLNFL